MSQQKRRYTKAEREAFDSGQGYAVARSSHGMNIKNLKLRKSFAKGYANGREMISKGSKRRKKDYSKEG